MIILSRKTNQSIIIDGRIRVMVSSIAADGSKVRIGIDAPREIPVHREEIQEAIDAEHLADEREPLA